jgi:hypothetical protein
MYPYNISSQEIYGKHRHSDEVRELERQNHLLKARSHRYGDPVYSKVDDDGNTTKDRLSEKARIHKKSGEAPFLARIILSFLPFLGSR